MESRTSERRATSFAELVSEVSAPSRLGSARCSTAPWPRCGPCGPDAVAAIDALRSLCMRGGKRLRAVLVAAAYEACGGDGGRRCGRPRRGGARAPPGVPARPRRLDGRGRRPARRAERPRDAARAHTVTRTHGDAAAILAGDFASALAQQALLSMPLAGDRVRRGGARVCARAARSGHRPAPRVRGAPRAEVESVHDLKTGSYTVRGPLAIGARPRRRERRSSARPSTASPRRSASLSSSATICSARSGTPGDGQAAGNDLRRGKRTALVVGAAGDAQARRASSRVLGVARRAATPKSRRPCAGSRRAGARARSRRASTPSLDERGRARRPRAAPAPAPPRSCSSGRRRADTEGAADR